MNPITPDVKYCLYARKSSEQDERQAMSIDSQLKEMTDMADREGLNIVEIKQESHSAKQSGQRPIFNEMVRELRQGKFTALLSWDPSRLSRCAGDLGSLVDLMDTNHLVHIRTFGQSFSNTPNEKFLLMILCSQAKLENDNRGVNVKRGIRAKCEMGWRPCMPPLGYFTRGATGGAKDVILDEQRAPYIVKMFEMSAAGKSGRHIRRWLEDNNVRTRGDKQIPLSMIYKMLGNSFYYGEFEYPKASGKWYKGNHAPMITKDLFLQVHEQLKVPIKSKWGAKEFPYKQFLRCYSCGSTIIGEEKFKTRLDGSKNRFVYYHCSRQVKLDCKEPYAREQDIVDGLNSMCNELITNLGEIEPGLCEAIDKFTRMMNVTHETGSSLKMVGSYIKYVLRDGTLFEKTRLVRNLSIEIALKDRKLLKYEPAAKSL
jgi:site-specific DNA recombinase